MNRTSAFLVRFIKKYQADHAKLGYIALLGWTSDFSVILDTQMGEQLEIVDIDPYQMMIDKQTQSDP